MNLRSAPKRTAVVIAAAGLLGLVLAGALTQLRTDQYRAGAQAYLTSSGATTLDPDVARQRVASYSHLLTSTRGLTPVVQRLGLEDSPESLAARITADNPPGTLVIDISVTDSQPDRATTLANALVESLPTLIRDVEGASPTPTTAALTVTQTQVATSPSEPVPSPTGRWLAVGALLGSMLGGAWVLARRRDRRPPSVSVDESPYLDGAPVLATLAATGPATHGLHLDARSSPRAASFDMLCANLRYASIDRGLRSVVVTSAVDGPNADVAAADVAANLAIALARAGTPAVLVDTNLRRPLVASMLGLRHDIGLTSVLLGDTDAGETACQWREELPLWVLASGPVPPNPVELIASERLAALLRELSENVGTLILTAPSITSRPEAAALSHLTDGALVVMDDAVRPARDQDPHAWPALRHSGARVLGVVLDGGAPVRVPAPIPLGENPFQARRTPEPGVFDSITTVDGSSPRAAQDVTVTIAPVPVEEPVPGQVEGPVEGPSEDQCVSPVEVSDPLPPAVRAVIASPRPVRSAAEPESPLPAVSESWSEPSPLPQVAPPTPRTRRAVRAEWAQQQRLHEPEASPAPSPVVMPPFGPGTPDLVIDADAGTFSSLEPAPAGWPDGWGEVPALAPATHPIGQVNGHGRGGGRHRN